MFSAQEKGGECYVDWMECETRLTPQFFQVCQLLHSVWGSRKSASTAVCFMLRLEKFLRIFSWTSWIKGIIQDCKHIGLSDVSLICGNKTTVHNGTFPWRCSFACFQFYFHFKASRRLWGPTQPPTLWLPKVEARGVMLTTHHLCFMQRDQFILTSYQVILA